ncbi:hypothetical protein [uncultured Ruegeria sp.]|uniref:hypothetical protein n=1 Tax=uncultured Ruegeria sp. TaxID=259304 RepID=UPI002614FBCF|nr:hypothetical protein [uncultured Ruegeria sp.]
MAKIFYFFFLPLLVAVLAGAFAYHYPKFFVEEGGLIYSQSRFVAPTVDEESYRFHYINITNQTSEIQKNVDLSVAADEELQNLEILSSDLNGQKVEPERITNEDGFTLKLGTLKPRESISIQLILRSESTPILRFYVESEALIGEMSNESDVSIDTSPVIRIAFTLLIGAFLVLPIVLYFRYNRSIYGNVNDTAFTLLHCRDIATAKDMLEKKIAHSGGSVYHLTNLSC